MFQHFVLSLLSLPLIVKQSSYIRLLSRRLYPYPSSIYDKEHNLSIRQLLRPNPFVSCLFKLTVISDFRYHSEQLLNRLFKPDNPRRLFLGFTLMLDLAYRNILCAHTFMIHGLLSKLKTSLFLNCVAKVSLIFGLPKLLPIFFQLFFRRLPLHFPTYRIDRAAPLSLRCFSIALQR